MYLANDKQAQQAYLQETKIRSIEYQDPARATKSRSPTPKPFTTHSRTDKLPIAETTFSQTEAHQS